MASAFHRAVAQVLGHLLGRHAMDQLRDAARAEMDLATVEARGQQG